MSRPRPSKRTPLRVLANTVALVPGALGTYPTNQLAALDRRADFELTIAAGRLADQLTEACPRAHLIRQETRPLLVRMAWEQVFLPRLAARFDVLYMMGGFAS